MLLMTIKRLIFVIACILLTGFTASAQTLTPAERAALQQELAQVEAEQKAAAADLAKAQSQSASLTRDISVLDAKIKKAQLNIKAKNLLIQSLGTDITEKQKHINKLEDHIAKGKESLSSILRKMNEAGSYSLPEMMLSQKTLTGFFNDVDSFQSVQQSLKETFETLRADEISTTEAKNTLVARQNAEKDARHAIEVEQANIKEDQNERKQLLSISKGNEKAYSTALAQKQARAAQIRAQLFALRDAAAIPFGQALQYAEVASKKTGVRPAFLLAIMTQESALGKNVGQCYVTNLQTGDGINAKSGKALKKVMNPTRDVPAFTKILSQIGGEATKQVVSCPLEIGWGGAMGPAQFIASTWMMFVDRIAAAVGISGMPDPWNPSHAFMASAIYLSDLGASNGGYSAERNAACRYYSGKSCGAVSGNTTYGNSVVSKADTIQRTMIDPLN